MTIAALKEAKTYLTHHPDLETLEVLTPDMNGMLRAKRIPGKEIET